MIRHYWVSIALMFLSPLPWAITPSAAGNVLTTLMFVAAWIRLGRDLERAGHRHVIARVPESVFPILALIVAIGTLVADAVEVRNSAVTQVPSDNGLRAAAALLAIVTGFELARQRHGAVDMLRGMLSSPGVALVLVWLGLSASFMNPAGAWVGRLLVVVGCGAGVLSARARTRVR